MIIIILLWIRWFFYRLLFLHFFFCFFSIAVCTHCDRLPCHSFFLLLLLQSVIIAYKIYRGRILLFGHKALVHTETYSPCAYRVSECVCVCCCWIDKIPLNAFKAYNHLEHICMHACIYKHNDTKIVCTKNGKRTQNQMNEVRKKNHTEIRYKTEQQQQRSSGKRT